MNIKINIKDVPVSEMPAVAKELGLKSYAANQIIQWLYQKGVSSFDEMTNLSKGARDKLAEKYFIGGLRLDNKLESKDGTTKYAWKLADGKIIESVLILSDTFEEFIEKGGCYNRTIEPSNHRTRLTLCISTQVGCAMGCTVCRTAKMGFIRNLTQGEIVEQILEAQRILFGHPCEGRDLVNARGSRFCGNDVSKITNVVLMGMGEPLMNYDNVVGAIRIMIDANGIGLSKRRITLSTCGLVPEIAKLAKEKLGIKLAISLSGTTDESRSKIMPVSKKYPLADLMNACEEYAKLDNRHKITFEYVMVNGVNDSDDDVKRLVGFMSRFSSKINLIPFNQIGVWPQSNKGPDPYLKPSPRKRIDQFAEHLRNKHIQVNIRASRGQDILAACGQLASKS